jgi:hypothetical protein
MVCFKENGRPDDVVYPAELQDNWLLKVDCCNGHSSLILLQQQRFEILSEIAVNAIADGYYREGVASFAAALERFYEFSVRVLFATSKERAALVEALWKDIGRQSERQLGAYMALVAFISSSPALTLKQKTVELRNDVIHRGKLPNRTDTIKFGDEVIGIISPTLRMLQEKHPNEVQSIVVQQLQVVADSAKGLDRTTMCHPTIVSLTRDVKEPQPTIEQWLNHLQRQRVFGSSARRGDV